MEEKNTTDIELNNLVPLKNNESVIIFNGDINLSCLDINNSRTKFILSTNDYKINIGDVKTKRILKVLSGHIGFIYSIYFNYQGTKIVSTSRDNTIKIWDVETGECLNTLNCMIPVKYASFNNIGNYIVYLTEIGEIKILDIETGIHFRNFATNDFRINSVDFNYDGSKIIIGYNFGLIKILDIETTQNIDLSNNRSAVKNLFFNFNKIKFASFKFFDIKIWCSTTGECLNTLTGNNDNIFSLSFNFNGDMILSFSYGKVLKFWDLEKSKCLESFTLESFCETGNVNQLFIFFENN